MNSYKSNYSIKKYPDGSSYVNVTGKKIATFRINSYEDLWHLNQYVDAFNARYDFEPNIIIPNLLDAQADRRFNTNESFGLKLICNFLKGMKVKKFYVFHPHNASLLDGILDNVEIMDNTRFIEQVICSIAGNVFLDEALHSVKDNLILMSSDAGGFKPLMDLCNKLDWKGETFSASKYRSWDDLDGTKFIQQIDREDFGGKDILIVDDLCIYGGTFKGISNILTSKKGINRKFLAVSHLTMQNHKGDNTVFDYYDRVFTTNSKFDTYSVVGNGGNPVAPTNLKVIKEFFT